MVLHMVGPLDGSKKKKKRRKKIVSYFPEKKEGLGMLSETTSWKGFLKG